MIVSKQIYINQLLSNGHHIETKQEQNFSEIMIASKQIYINQLLKNVTICLFLFLLLYVPSQQLWSLRDGQFT